MVRKQSVRRSKGRTSPRQTDNIQRGLRYSYRRFPLYTCDKTNSFSCPNPIGQTYTPWYYISRNTGHLHATSLLNTLLIIPKLLNQAQSMAPGGVYRTLKHTGFQCICFAFFCFLFSKQYRLCSGEIKSDRFCF